MTTTSNNFQTITVSAHYPATELVWPEGVSVLLQNLDAANTVYLGDNNAIEAGDLNNTIPLTPGGSYVAGGNVAIFGICLTGQSALVARAPDALNFTIPPSLSGLGGAKIFVQSTTPTGVIPLNSLWFNTTLQAIEYWNGAAWAVQQFNAQELIQVSTILAAQIANATLTSAQLSAAAGILGSQIAAATITGSNIAANTIVASNIAANTITAAQLAAGIIYAGIVDGTTIQAADFIGGNYFGYTTSSPTLNGLAISMVPGTVAVTDSAGNAALPGVTTYGGSTTKWQALNLGGNGLQAWYQMSTTNMNGAWSLQGEFVPSHAAIGKYLTLDDLTDVSATLKRNIRDPLIKLACRLAIQSFNHSDPRWLTKEGQAKHWREILENWKRVQK